jgi:signal recognition particle receptor subunit alpha
MASLDFSYVQVDSPANEASSMDLTALVDQTSMGTRTSEGMYEVKDWEFDTPAPAAVASASAPAGSGSSLGALGSLFSRITGAKTLTQADLAPVLEGMKQHLMKKNVAREIAEKVVEGVGEDLVGRRITGWGGTNTAVRSALSAALTRILTPKTSTDLLLSIRTKLSESQSSMIGGSGKKEPYSIVFVGVNGVGKSTNLSKVCFWLVQNGMRVLIAACDTFRCATAFADLGLGGD